MADFSILNPWLATGAGISSPDDVQQLLSVGVEAIIDCRDDFDDGPLLAASGAIYLYNPTADDGQAKPPEWFDRSWRFVQGFLRSKPGRHDRVYCHCAAGVHRGPTTAVYLMCARDPQLKVDDAISQVRARRPNADPAYYRDSIIEALRTNMRRRPQG